MEAKIAVPTPPSPIGCVDMNSGCSSPYVSAPSSPPALRERLDHLLFYYSAPNSPRSVSSNYQHQPCDLLDASGRSVHSSIPYNWEDKPGIPKFKQQQDNGHGKGDHDDGFEFFSGHLDAGILPLSADELFDGGIIRPLKPPPGLQLQQQRATTTPQQITIDSLKSPRSPISKFPHAFTPQNKQHHDEFDPFEAALERTRTETRDAAAAASDKDNSHRGRSGNVIANSNSQGAAAAAKTWRLRRRISRSQSPLRVSEFALLQQGEEEQALINQQPNCSNCNSKDHPASSSSSNGIPANRKWRLRDLLLFRSASEGRSTSRDPLKYKYFTAAALQHKKKNIDNSSTSSNIAVEKTATESFESLITCSPSSDQSSIQVGSISSQRRMGQQIPATPGHELHHYYMTASRAVSEETKKKTPLPYRHAGLLGCLGVNSSSSARFRELSRGNWFS